jgi:hypothetical protein
MSKTKFNTFILVSTMRNCIAATDKVGITSAPQSSASDETPMIIIIPGLTSDLNDSVSLGHKIVHCHSLDKLTDITTSVTQQFSQVLFFWRYSAI